MAKLQVEMTEYIAQAVDRWQSFRWRWQSSGSAWIDGKASGGDDGVVKHVQKLGVAHKINVCIFSILVTTVPDLMLVPCRCCTLNMGSDQGCMQLYNYNTKL